MENEEVRYLRRYSNTIFTDPKKISYLLIREKDASSGGKTYDEVGVRSLICGRKGRSFCIKFD